MGFIILEQKKISFDEIRYGLDKTGFSLYSKQIISFCTAWLNGHNAFEISTSGSTGSPQKITWSRELMLWSINNTATALQLKKDMHCLHCIDASKAGGRMMLARALQLEMSMEIIEPSSNPFNNSLSPHFDFGAMVPLQLHEVLQEDNLSELKRIDKLIIGGASLSRSMKERLQNVHCKIFATYGMTETASHIALQQINGKKKQEGFIVFRDVKIQMDHEQCAIISTPYHENLQTNDIIKINPDHSFTILGRRDHIINSGGYKIPIEKIEAAVDQTLTSLKINFFNYCAYKQEDEKFGEVLILIFESVPFDKERLSLLKEELGTQLNRYEMPKKYYFTEKLKYTSSGKIDRKASAEKVLG